MASPVFRSLTIPDNFLDNSRPRHDNLTALFHEQETRHVAEMKDVSPLSQRTSRSLGDQGLSAAELIKEHGVLQMGFYVYRL